MSLPACHPSRAADKGHRTKPRCILSILGNTELNPPNFDIQCVEPPTRDTVGGDNDFENISCLDTLWSAAMWGPQQAWIGTVGMGREGRDGAVNEFS